MCTGYVSSFTFIVYFPVGISSFDIISKMLLPSNPSDTSITFIVFSTVAFFPVPVLAVHIILCSPSSSSFKFVITVFPALHSTVVPDKVSL